MICRWTWKQIITRRPYDNKCLSLSYEISVHRPCLCSQIITLSVYWLTSQITRSQPLSNFSLKNFNIWNNSVPLCNIFYFRNGCLANNSTKPEIGKGFKKLFLTRWRKYRQDVRSSSLASLLGILKYVCTYAWAHTLSFSHQEFGQHCDRVKYATDGPIVMFLWPLEAHFID